MTDVNFRRPPLPRQRTGKETLGDTRGRASSHSESSRPSLMDKFGSPEGYSNKRQRGRSSEDGESVGARKKQSTSRPGSTGVFNNIRRSSVVRKMTKISQRAFNESAFFAEDGEDGKENRMVRSRMPQRISPIYDDDVEEEDLMLSSIPPNSHGCRQSSPYPQEAERRSGSILQAPTSRVAEEYAEEAILPFEMEKETATLPTGKLLERQQLIKQIVASCHQSGTTEEEGRLEACAASNYRKCRNIAEIYRENGHDMYDMGCPIEYKEFALAALHAMAKVQDLYDAQVASPFVAQPVQRTSERRTTWTSPQRITEDYKPEAAEVKDYARETSSQPQPKADGSGLQGGLRKFFRGITATVEKAWDSIPSRAMLPASNDAVQRHELHYGDPFSADETIAQSMMLPDVVTP